LREKSLNFCSAQRLYDSNAVQFGDKWSFWVEDADIIDQLAKLDLTGADLIECMYGYTEMEALATYFDMDS
jgi:hypothetical protein